MLALLCAIGAPTPTFGQSCGSPITAAVGDTPFSTTPGQVALLSTAPQPLCDVSAFGSNVIYNVTWFRFVPPDAATYRFETCGLVNFDSRLAVLTNCADPTSCVGGDDDSPGCTLASSTVAWASQVEVQDAAAGTPLFIGVGAFSSGTQGSGSLRIVRVGSPENGQACATAYAVGGSPQGTTRTFSNAAATGTLAVPPSCDFGAVLDNTIHRPVWFRFTASTNTIVEVSTCPVVAGEPGFDTRIAVFADCGSSAGSGSVVACNDDAPGCQSFGSTVRFNVSQGSVYSIAVGGRTASSTGAGVLRITTDVPPPPSCGTAPHPCCKPSDEPFCSDGACCALVCAEDPFCCSSDGAWDAVCAQRAAVLCSACGAGDCPPQSSTRSEPEACGAQSNGGCEQSPPAAVAILPGDAVAGTFWADADERDVDAYEFTLAAAATVSLELTSSGPGRLVLTDDACPPAIIVATPELERSCPASISTCLAPGTYRVIAQMTVFSGFPCGGDRNGYVLAYAATSCDAAVPANDDCASALPIPAAGTVVPVDTRLATNSPSALPASCDEGSGTSIVRDVWFSWRPPAGIARVATCDGIDGGTDFDTRLAAYASCGGALVACNDDSPECSGFRSVMTFAADGTTTYLVRLGGFDSAGSGTVRFDALSPLTNDDCASPLPVSEGTVVANTLLATDSPVPLPDTCKEGFGTDIRKDVWFAYTATCDGFVTASTCITGRKFGAGAAEGFDTWLAAYLPATGGCPGTLVACNDDAVGCDLLTSRIQFEASAGTTYLIRLGGHDDSGSAELSIACAPTPDIPANDACATAIPILAGESLGLPFDNTSAASDAPTVPSGGCAGELFLRDVWFEYVPARGGLTTFSLCGSSFDSRMELWTGCPGAGGQVIACNDDSCGGQSAITLLLACEVPSVLVRVGSFSAGSFGPGVLTVQDGILDCSDSCRADITGDGLVDGADLGRLLSSWGPNRGAADLNGDGSVNGADLGILVSAWGNCPN